MKLANSTLIACLTTLALSPLGCDPSVDDSATTGEGSSNGNDEAGDEDDSESGVDEDEDDDAATTGPGTAESGDDESASGTTSDSVGETTDDSESDSDSSGEPPPVDGYSAYAIRFGDIPDLDDESGTAGSGSDTTDGGSDIDPDSLQVNISTGPESCEDPHAILPCGGHWSVNFTLSPEQQAVGTYLLFEETNGFFTETGELYPEGDCSWGGGTLEGTVEIVEISDTEVRGVVLSDGIFAPEEVEFVAPRCD